MCIGTNLARPYSTRFRKFSFELIEETEHIYYSKAHMLRFYRKTEMKMKTNNITFFIVILCSLLPTIK